MSGRVISKPPREHHCRPGWTWKPCSHDRSDYMPCAWPADEPHSYGIPPTPWDYPKGTVWECDCGKRWVSGGRLAPNAPGICTWRREHVRKPISWPWRRK
jgi:hypothetical protein